MEKNQTYISTNLISVIIPCYNHGHYLSAAIESVLAQTYPFVEIVVIDDGSTDNTKEIAARYDKVKYVYQANGGLSAARNKGIEQSTGSYLLFLDADDWLYPHALQVNYNYLQQNGSAAFVSGSHDKYFEAEKRFESIQRDIKADHYKMFLSLGNYIGVPAAVLYRRWVFKEFEFSTQLKACEDYHLYLQIARIYPVMHHKEKVAVYRQHLNNMSSNLQMMLKMALHVLNLQKQQLRNESEKIAFKQGKKFWKSYYINLLYKTLASGNNKVSNSNVKMILSNKPQYLLRFIKEVIAGKFQLKLFKVSNKSTF